MYYIDIFLIFIYVYVFHLLFLYRCTVALSRMESQVLSLPAPLSSQAAKRLLMTQFGNLSTLSTPQYLFGIEITFAWLKCAVRQYISK